MAILDMPPSPSFKSHKFGPVTNSFNHTSPLSQTTQSVEFPGSHWSFEGVLPIMVRGAASPDVEEWISFLTELDGTTGRFYAGDPLGATPRGAVGTSAPLVNGASQTGKTLMTDGWDAGATFLKGDYFAVPLPSGGRSLHKLITDMTADGSGNATPSFRPALRESPADNAALIIQSASCVMRLVDDKQAQWPVDEAGHVRIAFAAIESFNVG